MPRFERGLLASLLAGVLLVAGCGGDDPMEPEPESAPPDLSGSYTLQSFSSAVVTGGNALTSPVVSGMFTLEQTSVAGEEASGTMALTISVPDDAGGTFTIEDQGTYKNRMDGQWEQAGDLQQAKGTYELEGNTLTLTVTEPVLAISNTVWRRQ